MIWIRQTISINVIKLIFMFYFTISVFKDSEVYSDACPIIKAINKKSSKYPKNIQS